MEKRTSQAVLHYQPDGLCQTMNTTVYEQMTSIYFILKKKKLRCQHHTKSQRQSPKHLNSENISKAIKQRKQYYIWNDDGKPVVQWLPVSSQMQQVLYRKWICFMLTGSSGFLVRAKAQTKPPDSALQLVK